MTPDETASPPTDPARLAKACGTAKVVRVCDTCPWRRENHGKPHPAGWYKVSNLRRLWNGIRTASAPGMICHSSDPKNVEYGGDADIKPGHEHECAGAVALVIMNVNALNNRKPQPIQPAMTKRAIAYWFERLLFGRVPAVESKYDPQTDIGVPWCPPGDPTP